MAKRKSQRSYLLRAAVCDALENRTLLAFGLTTTSTHYTVDTGAGVTFSILRGGTTSSTIHLGDMTSFKLNGTEFSAPYSTTSRYAHFESGLGGATVMTATEDPNWIVISCDDTGAGYTGVIQYYIAKKDDPTIYMATYAPEMRVSSTRYIAYLDRNKFPYLPDESDAAGNTGGIETGDVQGHADGTTSSKYYGETRNIDHLYHGVSGPSAGAYMFIGNRERGAGGPFWKDIDFQSGSAVEIYTMPFSGHSLTDTFRPGLHGPFALVLTDGAPPTRLPDYSFLDGVGLTGWVGPAGRGALSGRATGVATGKIATVGLSNTAAQYWANPDADGNYIIEGILPGTYTETLYEEELAVGTRSVTITAGQTKRADITATAMFGLSGSNNTFSSFNAGATPIWRIGTWDGTPREFLNGDKITYMHPSDVRLSNWASDSTGMTNFIVGTSKDSDWPMAEWKTQVGSAPWVDTRNRITFTLNSTQRATQLTLRIGVTRLDGSRPGVSANGGATQWSNTILSQPDARGVSLGNWRGNNGIYSYTFNANTLNVGTNTFDIYTISGSSGSGYYSVYHIYDAVDLIPTSSTGVPAITSLTISPGAGSNLNVNGTRKFIATANSSRPANVIWSTTNGTINDAGEYTAPATTGTAIITATYGAVNTNITVNIVNTAPTIAVPAAATPNPTYSKSTTLSVLGADNGGEAALTYTWAIVGTQPGTVTFGAGNGTNAAKNISATFSAYGVYTVQATITDGSGNTTVSQTSIAALSEKAYYKFDMHNGSGLTDLSGNVNFGSVYGDFSYPLGVSKNALNLAGGGVTLPEGIVSGLTDFTVAAWVKPDSLADWARIFDFGTGESSYMFLTARATGAGLRFAITNSGIGAEQVINGPALNSGVWTHVAVSLSGSTATLYVNGVAVATNAAMTLTPSSLGVTDRNFIGESQFLADPSFMGSIDEFHIYGRALTGTEVTALATRPTVTTAAAASPGTVTATTTALSVLGADALVSESSLIYAWSLVGMHPGTVSFSANNTNAAKNTTATFSAAGTYKFRVTITNPNGLSTTSDVTVTVSQTLTSVTVTPTPVTVTSTGTQQFTATALDQFADPFITPPTFTWAKTSGVGSIDSSGLYTAPATAGIATITATSGTKTGSASITVTNAVPTIVTAAAATPSPVTGAFTSLSALGNDTDISGEAALTYTWSLTGTPPAAVTYFVNGTNAAKNTTANFTKAGTYNFRVTIADPAGATALSNVTVVVNQTLSSVAVSPATASLNLNATQQFTATARDQFADAMASQPTFSWSVMSGVGSINSSGLYSSLLTPGSATILAVGSGYAGNASITVTSAAPTVATPAGASLSPVTGVSTTLSALGADDAGEASLTYTWSVTAKPSGAADPTFSVNGTNAAKSSVASFSKAGSYTFLVTIADAQNQTITSSATVVVNQTLSSIVVSPANVTLNPLGTHQFSAVGYDQFAAAMVSQPGMTWALASGTGSIDGTGLYTAPAGSGSATVTATSGAITSAPASITINNAAPTVATPAGASPSLVNGTTTTLSVLGADDAGEANLTYTWSILSKPIGAADPTFSVNGTNAAKSSVATFSQDGSYTFLVTIADAQSQTVTSQVSVGVDTIAPQLSSGGFDHTATRVITLSFSEDVLESLGASDFTITNQTAGSVVPPADYIYNATGGIPTVVTLTPVSSSALTADGNYVVSITGVTDAAGNALPNPTTFSFWILGGDANRDRKVNTQDFNVLAGSFGQSGKTFADGNFDYDGAGVVDSTDFTIFAGQYGKTLPAPAEAMSASALFGSQELSNADLLEL